MNNLVTIMLAVMVAVPAGAASFLVPPQLENVEGDAGFFFGDGQGNGEEVRIQALIPRSQFNDLVGFVAIKSFSFRADRTFQDDPVAFSAVIPSMEITLSTTRLKIEEFSSDLDANFTVNKKTVISGPLVFSSSGVGGFDIPFAFDQPFNYNPGTGNLIIDFRWSGVTTIPPHVDGTTDAGAGFGVVSQICEAGQCEDIPVQVLPGGGIATQFDVNTENEAVSLTSGSPATLIQTADTPVDPVNLSFDYLFESVTGELTVSLGTATLAVIPAPAAPEVDFTTATVFVDDPLLLDQSGLDLAFTIDGLTGSSILLDNVSFPGLQNGTFDSGLTGWTGVATGTGSVTSVAISTAVPEPTTVALFTLGLVGVAARKDRSPAF